MEEVCKPDSESVNIILTEYPNNSQTIIREETGSVLHQDTNLQLFVIIEKLKYSNNYEGNPNFQFFQMCFEQLVRDSKIDINRTDDLGNSPLHYTVKYKWDKLTKLLLEHNAYIGVKNANGELPIEGINCNILSEFFDSRITSNDNQQTKNDARPEINLDYSFLIRKPNKLNKFSTNTNQFYPIQFMSESEDLKTLSLHPLIHYLIWTKAEMLVFLFIWNLLTFLLSLSSIVYITFFRVAPTNNESKLYYCMHYLTIAGTWISILVNVFMLVFKYLDYKNSSARVLTYLRRQIIPILFNLSIPAILLIIFYLDAGEWRKSLTAACILLIAIDMNQILTTFPKFQKMSVHFIMLKKITTSFLKVLLFYLIILCAFSLSFYVLGEQNDTSKISQLLQLFVRIIGMMIGELNLNEFNGQLAVDYLLMLVFIFMITIVLINLLNGLAITDVGEIRLQAKLIYLEYRVQLIASCNNFFTNYVRLRYSIFRLTCCLARTLACCSCSSCLRCSLCFKVDVALCRYVKEIKIQPNRNLSTITNILKPTDHLDVDIIEWNKINKNILNKLLAQIDKKYELQNAIIKENEIMNMMVQINQKLDMLMSRPISI